MAKRLIELPQLVVEEIKIKDYEVVLLYEEKTMKFFWIIVNGEYNKEITDNILKNRNSNEMEIWLNDYNDSIKELNIKLVDYILNEIDNVYN